MKYGFNLSTSGPAATPEHVISLARRGEELGFHSIMVGEHLVVPNQIDSHNPVVGKLPAGWTDGHLEQLTLLSFLAGATQRIRLVPSVMVLPHRNPILAAKMLATLDVLSQGRLTLGVGVGWMREEFEALELPPFAERAAVSDEYLLAMKELWTSDTPTFEGKYCRFSNISFLPKPVQKPHPPIWVGGQSTRAIRRAARLGNGWHPVASPQTPLEPDDLGADIRLLATYAQIEDRDPSEIEVALKVHLYDKPRDEGMDRGQGKGDRRFTGSPEQIAADIRTYEWVGVHHIIFDVRTNSPAGILERLEMLATQVIPRV